MSNHKKIRVAVLFGGPSAEHEVSLKSGEMVYNAVPREKYEVRKVFIDRAGQWEIPPGEIKNYADVVFIALHGPYGEDGTVQDILEKEKVPYTGSGARESALAMNKFLFTRLLKEAGITVPLTKLFTETDWREQPAYIAQQIRHYFGYPLVVKPNQNGSSVGVTIVKDEIGLTSAFNEAFRVGREALVQEFVAGRELTCGVLDAGLPGSEFALLPTEIIPKTSNFFDYRAKYEPGASAEITPPNLPERTVRKIRDVAKAVHRLAGCRGFSRTDMILDKNGELYVLEINTIPGLTGESLLPKAALASGIMFPVLLDKIISAAFLTTKI
jgi:D-alanine-D-alanine ligase